MSRLTIERILSKCEEDGDCLIWKGSTFRNGRPSASEWIDGKDVYVAVRRRTYEEYHGRKVPDDKQVATCGHPACLAKAHLKLVTLSEKITKSHADMDAATKTKRAKAVSSHMREQRGSLTPEQVQAVKDSEEGPYVTARKLGISGRLASRIKRGLSYKSYEASPFSGLGA